SRPPSAWTTDPKRVLVAVTRWEANVRVSPLAGQCGGGDGRVCCYPYPAWVSGHEHPCNDVRVNKTLNRIVRIGSKADKPSQVKICCCPLLSQ
ncbi:MAG: hypothetical protein ACHQ1H_06465, partial [Nitrososphaerales archaeon]